MNHRLLIGSLFLPPLVFAGCFQELDTGAALGGAAGGTGTAPASTTCAPESPECFAMCNSPSCFLAVPDGSIPTATETPPIYDLLGEGGSTLDPCAQMESESMAIRTRSCAQCHTALKQGGFDYVLDDGQLTTQSSSTYTNPATGKLWRMIVPGDPASSLVYARIVGGTMPPADGTITGILGQQVGATVMRPTVSDQSVLYTWILNCLPGADGGAYSIASYGAGPDYGPTPGGNGPGMGGGDAGSAPTADGGDD